MVKLLFRMSLFKAGIFRTKLKFDLFNLFKETFSIAGKNPIVLILIPCKKVEYFNSQSRYHKSDLLIVKQCL